ncbi:MAG: hypothetical protein K6F71_07575 [Ruminococcus sp.]|uniref:hypothetical protein n=1 Tax=Ruminococcus sp. TaxID=41978 RepID=UPI0025F36340|nr:hypothetical protein [Ruminococcus sp.]MCR5540661.1 hypothetical protein [Ruminococcus sp.]
MKNIFVFNLKNSFRSLGFIFSIIAVFAFCIANMMILAWQCRNLDSLSAISASEAFLLRTDVPLNNMFRTLYVFLIVFPVGFIAYKNNKINITPVFKTRASAYSFATSEALTSFVSAFLCFFIPLSLSILLNGIVFSGEETVAFSYNYAAALTGDNVFQNSVSKGEPFLGLFLHHPQLYNLLYAFIFSTFCGILSMFICAIANFIKSLPIFLLLPVYMLHYIMKRVDAIVGSGNTDSLYLNVDMTDYIMIRTFYGKSLAYFLILCVFLIIFSCLLYIINYKKDVAGSMRIWEKLGLSR